MAKFLILFLAFVAVCYCKPAGSKPFQNVFKDVPVTARREFICYHLLKGSCETHNCNMLLKGAYPLVTSEKLNEIQNVSTSADFSKELYVWTTRRFKITDEQVRQLVYGDIICEGNECIDVGDVGSVCCT